MIRESKRSKIQRISRILYLKIVYRQLIIKSLKKNSFTDKYIKTSIMDTIKFKKTYPKKLFCSKSSFRLFCMLDDSPKLVNKKFRLSRFSFNKFGLKGNLPGIFRKGW